MKTGLSEKFKQIMIVAGLLPLAGFSGAETDSTLPTTLQYSDVFNLEYPSAPQFTPDGEHIIYARKSMDIMTDRTHSALWKVNIKAGTHRPLMAETKRAINRVYAIMGLDEALEEGLEIDIGIEGQGMPTKSRFLAITREQGLRAALVWRDRKR